MAPLLEHSSMGRCLRLHTRCGKSTARWLLLIPHQQAQAAAAVAEFTRRPLIAVLQIEPHDCIAELFAAIERFNTILLDFDRWAAS